MKLFAFMWTVLFLLAIVPVMRLDNDRHLRRLWREVSEATRDLGKAYVYLGLASRLAGESINSFIESYANPEYGQLYYSDDTNEVFVWDGRMWERVRDY